MDQRDDSLGPRLKRRTFLAAAASIGAGAVLLLRAPEVLAAIEGSDKKILWVRGSGCGGCTESFLNGGSADILSALERLKARLAYHEGLMNGQGIFINGSPPGNQDHDSNLTLQELIKEKNYLLVVEGAIPEAPDGSGSYWSSAGTALASLIKDAARGADRILAVGTCASFGGISRAKGSTAEARGLAFAGAIRSGVFNDLGLTKDVINVPGCPPHPDWVLLTIADILAGSPVEVDSYCRPAAFFSSRPLHDSCLRRGSFDSLQRGERLADGECTYGLGCKGTLSFADCPSRKWNGGVSMCTQAGGLCIACVEPEFPDAFSPFFSKIESREIISGLSLDTAAEIVIGAAALGAGLHAVKRLAVGESGREDMEVPEKKKKDKEGRIRRL